MPYRPLGDFSGRGSKKRLSAHTIASFMHLQRLAAVDQLSCDVPMNTDILSRLIRRSAINWWLNIDQRERSGEPAWLVNEGMSTSLTEPGLAKIIRRTQGEERTADGRISSYNVTTAEIQEALQLIEYGPNSQIGSNIELESI